MRRAFAITTAVMTVAAAVALIGPVARAGAAGPTVKVSPSVNITRSGQTFVVSGSGFSPTANGGLGVYVAFGPQPALHPADWFKNIEYYAAAVWVHPNGAGTTTNKTMNPNGTFSFTLTNADGAPIQPSFGGTDCTKVPCGIVTMAAHGSANRSQDSFRPVIYATADPTKAKVGVPYATKIARPSGVAPFAFALHSGRVPKGLSLATNGLISGTPTTEGVFKPVVEVTDAHAQKTTRALVIKVAPKAMVLKPSALPDGTKSVAYSRAVAASGGTAPYTYKLASGALPSGLSVNVSGTVSGTPTQRGAFTFVVRATDALTFTTSRTITLTIH